LACEYSSDGLDDRLVALNMRFWYRLVPKTQLGCPFRGVGKPDKNAQKTQASIPDHKGRVAPRNNIRCSDQPIERMRLRSTIADLRVAVRRYEYQHMSHLNLISTSASQHRSIIRAIAKRDLPTVLSGIEVNYAFGMQILLRRMGES
jgi:hypothetical protein